MTTVVTLTVQISRPWQEVFEFVADPATMPQWAIHNVRSIRPLGDGVWEIETPRGAGHLIPSFEETHGILDHAFVDPREGRWDVPARVVPAGAGESVYMITLAKPAAMPEEAFAQGMTLVQDELQAMKRILERDARNRG
jgi:hypothetical protein